jgi:tRNA-specific 2-thiouridylase
VKVLVAMSGGVDSSVAAALLVEEGHEVVGATLKQWTGPGGTMGGCCTVGDAEDARRVAAYLDVRHYVLDYVDEFRRAVVDPFTEAYLAGLTPNPCIECNRRVRFRSLLERAVQLGCDALATGHHARVVPGPDGPRLLRGADRAKDQSYVLYRLRRGDLARVVLPIGHLLKEDVRRHAARLGLRVAAKPDSQDLCFVGSEGVRGFLRDRVPAAARPGPVVDRAGNEVGRHGGVAGVTVGQRKGIGVAAGERRYVLEVRPSTATLVVGDRRALAADGCRVADLSWIGEPYAGRAEVQIRYRSPAVPCTVGAMHRGFADVRFDRPHEAVAPGQAAVFYRGDEVVGGGTIAGAP